MVMSLSKGIQTCGELLFEFKAKNLQNRGQRLYFSGVNGKDVYNITAPFFDEGKLVLAGRVESRNSEYSEVMFFTESGGSWMPRKNSRKFRLQDPFYSKVSGELVIGGVEVWVRKDNLRKLNWRTVFYRGKNINDLEIFAAGPDGMKDIRLVELKDGRIGVFTRPQGEIGGRGKIGFTIIDTLDGFNSDIISGASLINAQFDDAEWGGANELHLLKNGLIGVLGHIACYDEQENRHYYSMAFAFNPENGKASSMKLIAARENFDSGAAKWPDTVDVIFSGGLLRGRDGNAVLYVGTSDAEAHRITIPDPFLEYEDSILV